jgi:hypothetical protein
MGNQTSTGNPDKTNTNELKPKSISQVLDYIATYYIITMDFKSLRKLYEKEYCDKLVILTSDIIQRYFTELEITYLAQRVKAGVEVNELDKDKVIFFDRDNLSRLDVQNSIKKKRLCQSIAKFYIKIAHIFAAIVTTINPTYVYKDTEGNTVRADLYEKSKIPPNVPREIFRFNICDNRIKALNEKPLTPDTNGDVTISPKICTSNIGDNGQDKTLNDEPGIPELMDLYYDDNYDFKTGQFTSMSPATEKVFNEDLQIFYSVFTGKTDRMPAEVRRFSDIKLRDFHRLPDCTGDNPPLAKTVKGSASNKYFSDYANHLTQMINKANANQEALLGIINKLFVYTLDPQTNKKQIRVNPALTESGLQELVVETRALIIKLYLTCEVDFVNGIKLYQAIVEQKIFDTERNQLKYFDKKADELLTQVPPEVPMPAELQEIKVTAENKIAEQKSEINKELEQINQEEKVVKNPVILSGLVK